MPTYQYACSKCGHEFELFQSMKDNALAVCPKEKCAQKKWGKGKVQRQLGTGAGLIFKGSGFYITDYRSDNYKAAAKKDSGASSSTPAGGSAPASTAPSTTPKPSSGSGNTSKPKPAAT